MLALVHISTLSSHHSKQFKVMQQKQKKIKQIAQRKLVGKEQL